MCWWNFIFIKCNTYPRFQSTSFFLLWFIRLFIYFLILIFRNFFFIQNLNISRIYLIIPILVWLHVIWHIHYRLTCNSRSLRLDNWLAKLNIALCRLSSMLIRLSLSLPINNEYVRWPSPFLDHWLKSPMKDFDFLYVTSFPKTQDY